MAETRESARESKASRQATAAETEKPARAKADQEKPTDQPQPEPAGEPDPEWVALADRARAGGDDAAQALVDAYERGIRTGVERSEKLRSESGGKVSITTDDVAALTAPATGAVRGGPVRVIVSEGVLRDLERSEWVVDPGTGHKLRMDRETGEVTVVDRNTDEPIEGVQVVGPGNDPQHQQHEQHQTD